MIYDQLNIIYYQRKIDYYMHDFDYNYASCTNKLIINKDGGGEDYEYDASGCLIRDDYNGIANVSVW